MQKIEKKDPILFYLHAYSLGVKRFPKSSFIAIEMTKKIVNICNLP